jgi:hypothetical protein
MKPSDQPTCSAIIKRHDDHQTQHENESHQQRRLAKNMDRYV